MGQNAQKKEYINTPYEQTMKSLIRNGWSLDSTQVDTLFTKIKAERPETQIQVTRLKLDKDHYFESGKFELTESVKDSIRSSMEQIDGALTNIMITSSTDKQGLSVNLKNQLKDLGFSPDNKGLSEARSSSISEYLTSLGVSDTLVESQEKFEQGEGTINQSARYVSVDIYFIKIAPPTEPTDKIAPTIKKMYHLSKEPYKGKYTKIHPNGGSSRGEIRKFSYRIRNYECSGF
jgi:outer membrane protein OmpA-like peptidoglycan-associated protein